METPAEHRGRPLEPGPAGPGPARRVCAGSAGEGTQRDAGRGASRACGSSGPAAGASLTSSWSRTWPRRWGPPPQLGPRGSLPDSASLQEVTWTPPPLPGRGGWKGAARRVNPSAAAGFPRRCPGPRPSGARWLGDSGLSLGDSACGGA